MEGEKKQGIIFGRDASNDLLCPIAVDSEGRVMLCAEDRERMKRIERGVAYLVGKHYHRMPVGMWSPESFAEHVLSGEYEP